MKQRGASVLFLLLGNLILLGLLSLVHGDPCPTLQLKAVINRKRLPLGRSAKLTVAVRNTGTTAAANAVVQVVLPVANGLRYKSAKTVGHAISPPTFTQDGVATLRWALAELPPKKQAKLSIALWVDACGTPTTSAPVGVSVYQLAGHNPVCPLTATPTVAIVAPKSTKWGTQRKKTCSPTTASSMEPTSAPSVAPTQAPSDPVCYNKEAQVHMADGTRKAVYLLQKGERVATSAADDGSAAVVAVVEMYNAGNGTTTHTLFKDMCMLDDGFFISGTHPIRVGGRWIRPRWQFPCSRTMAFDALFGLVLDAGHSVAIHGFEVATFVAKPVGVALIDIPHKLQWYQAIAAAPGFAEGYVRIDARELATLRPANWDGSVYDRLQFVEEAVIAPATGSVGAASAM